MSGVCGTTTLSELLCSFFFFNDTATTEIYTLSLHDALPIYKHTHMLTHTHKHTQTHTHVMIRSEEHTSELQSHLNLVCRLLLDKKRSRTRDRRPHGWRGATPLARRHLDARAPCRLGIALSAHRSLSGASDHRACAFLLMMRRPPRPTLFPTRTPFR